MKTHAILFCWVFGGLCSVGAAQPVIRVGTRLVEVDAVVRDKNGPVRGLVQGDFELFDQGKQQKIALFHAVDKPPAQGSFAPLGEGVVSNRVDRAGNAAPNVTAILLDRLNTSVPDQVVANRQVLSALKSVQPPDRVALFTLGRRIRPIADFTADPEKVREALAKLRPEPSIELAVSDPDNGSGFLPDMLTTGNPRLDQEIQDSINTERQASMESRAALTAKAMELLARHLAGIPGRKNLIWISSSFPLSFEFREREDVYQNVRAAVRALNDANVAIYPVDPRGLDAERLSSAVTRTMGITAIGRAPQGRSSTSVGPSGIDTMIELAKQTGGRAFFNRNDLDDAVRAALDDVQSSYMLGFYPDQSSFDGTFHNLRVKVGRKGVDVLSRTRYFAGTLPALDDKELLGRMTEAFQNPLEASEVGLAAVVRAKDSTGKYVLRVSVNLADLRLQPDGDQWKASLNLGTLISAKGQGRIQVTQLTLRFTQQQWTAGVERGYVLDLPFEAHMEKTAVRAALQDRSTGNVGSVTLAVSDGN